jgi:hypothetical protein
MELHAGHLAVEIAVEPEQQIHIVQRQPNDRVDAASIDGVPRVADAVRVRARVHGPDGHRRRCPKKTSHAQASPRAKV